MCGDGDGFAEACFLADGGGGGGGVGVARASPTKPPAAEAAFVEFEEFPTETAGVRPSFLRNSCAALRTSSSEKGMGMGMGIEGSEW